MRKTELETETLELLLDRRYVEGVNSFRTTCDKTTDCKYVLDCLQRCLIPKLRYISLSNGEKGLEIVISELLDLWLIDEL